MLRKCLSRPLTLQSTYVYSLKGPRSEYVLPGYFYLTRYDLLVRSLLLSCQTLLHRLDANSLFTLPHPLNVRDRRVFLPFEDGVDFLQRLTLRLDPEINLLMCEPWNTCSLSAFVRHDNLTICTVGGRRRGM